MENIFYTRLSKDGKLVYDRFVESLTFIGVVCLDSSVLPLHFCTIVSVHVQALEAL